jgi:hypothetical protein
VGAADHFVYPLTVCHFESSSQSQKPASASNKMPTISAKPRIALFSQLRFLSSTRYSFEPDRSTRFLAMLCNSARL